MASWDNAILADEIGIQTGIVGPFRLKTAYQPVFSVSADRLEVAGMDAATPAWLEGAPVNDAVLLDIADPVERDFLSGLRQALQIKNCRVLETAPSAVHVRHDLAYSGRLFDIMANAERDWALSRDEPFGAENLVCRVRAQGASAQSIDDLQRLRSAGFRVALDIFDDAIAQPGNTALFRPDIAEVNALWFTRIAGEAAAAKLLRPLVAAHGWEGTDVIIRGISTAQHLAVAIDSGASFFVGDYLAPAVPAGVEMDEGPRRIGDLLAGPQSNVRPLFK